MTCPLPCPWPVFLGLKTCWMYFCLLLTSLEHLIAHIYILLAPHTICNGLECCNVEPLTETFRKGCTHQGRMYACLFPAEVTGELQSPCSRQHPSSGHTRLRVTSLGSPKDVLGSTKDRNVTWSGSAPVKNPNQPTYQLVLMADIAV